MQHDSGNHRDFYRIECRAIVGFRSLGERPPEDAGPDTFFSDSPALLLSRELLRLEQEATPILAAIGEKDRAVASYLHVINRRIDLLSRHTLAQAPDTATGEEQSISLSEGGVVFRCAQALRVGSFVALRLLLLPAWTGVTTFGLVLKSETTAAGDTEISVAFESLQDTERQLVARHVMQVQMAEQRRRAGRT